MQQEDIFMQPTYTTFTRNPFIWTFIYDIYAQLRSTSQTQCSLWAIGLSRSSWVLQDHHPRHWGMLGSRECEGVWENTTLSRNVAKHNNARELLPGNTVQLISWAQEGKHVSINLLTPAQHWTWNNSYSFASVCLCVWGVMNKTKWNPISQKSQTGANQSMSEAGKK
jgi:hypothetical protein